MLICVVPQGYRMIDYKVAAEYLFGKDSSLNWEEPTRSKRVYQISENDKIPSKGSRVEFTVFDLADTAIILTVDEHLISKELRFAADHIVHIIHPSAAHIKAARVIAGRPQISNEVASDLASRPQNIVIAALLRRNLESAHLTLLDDMEGAPLGGPTLNELPGYDILKDWALKVAVDTAAWRKSGLAWTEVGSGALLSGPPGTGKTMFADAFARSCGLKLVSTTVGEWQAAGHLGDTLQAMRRSFADAARADGAVLFIDELDGIGSRSRLSGDYVEYWRLVINEFLSLTSRLPEGVLLIGATNDPEQIDPAVLRSGRLEMKFELSLPDRNTRAEILAYHLGGHIGFEPLVNVVGNLDGWSGADLERLARNSKRRARAMKREVQIDDVLLALPKRKAYLPEVRFRLAVHESGHALVSLAHRATTSVTITVEETFDPDQQTNVGGRTSYDQIDDWLPTENTLLGRMATALGGLAAEEIVFRDRSIGSGGGPGSDVERATMIARKLVTSYGLGRIPVYVRAVGDVDVETILPADSENDVRELLAVQYQAVLDLLEPERERLIELARDAMLNHSVTIAREGGSDTVSL